MISHNLDFNRGTYVIGHYKYPKCPSCDDAKQLLLDNDIQYTFVQADKQLFGKVIGATKSQTVPQIFMDGEFIGGYENLQAKIGEKQ
jgi:glutaredoxin